MTKKTKDNIILIMLVFMLFINFGIACSGLIDLAIGLQICCTILVYSTVKFIETKDEKFENKSIFKQSESFTIIELEQMKDLSQIVVDEYSKFVEERKKYYNSLIVELKSRSSIDVVEENIIKSQYEKFFNEKENLINNCKQINVKLTKLLETLK